MLDQRASKKQSYLVLRSGCVRDHADEHEKRRDSIFSCGGERVIHNGGLSMAGDQHYFLLVMHRFCCNNVLY